ncbi:MAG: hypothetical protein EBR49_15695 [Betaproteobacteria bacterium]|jgi:hypothetical protein|nr:hypothetical protein [Betaproteobacteria bacterium]
MNELTNLVTELIQAKAAESQANIRRINIEQAIIKITGQKEEGSFTLDLENGMKLTVTGKLSYAADMSMLTQLCQALSPDMRPLKIETKLDETGCKYLRNNEPETWALIAPAITVKPAKTSITIKA